jgi:hypothetical protein
MAELPPVPDAGRCFLCTRVGAKRLNGSTPEYSASDTPIFRYSCPTCGEYLIYSVKCDDMSQQARQEFEDGGEPVREASPVEMESAALEHWNKSLETAERQRRLPKRTEEPTVRRPNADASSACA